MRIFHFLNFAACLALWDLMNASREVTISSRQNVNEIINLQPKGGQAKPYQVKQVRNIIVKYKLGELL